jgi:hypothetical protein
VTGGALTPDFLASSPNVLACGGTSCPSEGPETAWNDGGGHSSGGGYSGFDMPPYQYMSVIGDKRGEAAPARPPTSTTPAEDFQRTVDKENFDAGASHWVDVV